MNRRRLEAMRSAQLLWIILTSYNPGGLQGWSWYLINTGIPQSLPFSHVLALDLLQLSKLLLLVFGYQINYYWFNEPFAASQVQSCLYLHMHGLIF